MLSSLFFRVGSWIYVGMGLLQFLATLHGIQHWWGLHWLISIPAAFIAAYIPLLGSIAGMVGATGVWGWSWPAAILLFFWPYALYLVLLVLLVGSDLLNKSTA